MKNINESMSPSDAAQAFFGQDDATFSEMIAKLTANDPRLAAVFQGTRKRFLESKEA